MGKPFSSPEDIPDPRIKPGSHALQADSLPVEPPKKIDSQGKKKNSVKVQRSQDKLKSIIQMVWGKQGNNFSFRLY